jgi:transcriptional regulator with XRE-family HTH domain
MADYSLAQRLRVARAYKGWSQTELAKKAGLNNVQLSKLERGITKEILGTTLRRLCESLDVSPQYLLGMTDEMQSEQTPPRRRKKAEKQGDFWPAAVA